MRAVAPWNPDAPKQVVLIEWPEPEAGPGEVVLEVRATALNRADLLQVAGHYPPPPGETPVPGLEAAGVVASVGPGVEGWRPGDRAAALLAGGGHAERVAVPAGQLLAIPANLGFREAAALPEAAITAWTNLVAEGKLRAGEWVLISGATSGVGTFAVQLARELGARPIAAGRDPERLALLAGLGAEALVALDETLPDAVRAVTGGAGARLALDLIGGRWLPPLLAALAPGGRCILVGLVAGRRAELDLGLLLQRRLELRGSVLRPRPRAEKAELVAAFSAFAAGRLADGRLRPVIAGTYPFERIAAAYEDLAAGGRVGKLVLDVAPGPDAL
jgi:putative PIG3 family NAD(P)H quinone oxidoreductase